jgi:hypothetical protein
LLSVFLVGFIGTLALTITAGVLSEKLKSKDLPRFEALGRPGYLYFLFSVWSVQPRYLIFLLTGEALKILGAECASLLMLTRILIVISSVALFAIVLGGAAYLV